MHVAMDEAAAAAELGLDMAYAVAPAKHLLHPPHADFLVPLLSCDPPCARARHVAMEADYSWPVAVV